MREEGGQINVHWLVIGEGRYILKRLHWHLKMRLRGFGISDQLTNVIDYSHYDQQL